MMRVFPPNLNAMIVMAAKDALEAYKSARFIPLADHLFPAPSLSRWMCFVEAAGIPAVPIEKVGTFNIDLLLQSDPDETEKLNEINKNFAYLKEKAMMRWDCCASIEIKHAVANGHSPSAIDLELSALEPRTFDILFEFPQETVDALKRPWIEPKMYGPHAAGSHYPVEFRAYVVDGLVTAIANYYIQRDLPDTLEIRSYVKTVEEYAERIIDQVKTSGKFPSMSGQPTPESISATLDFIVDIADNVLFLEAGPGFGYGAHPCSFLNKDNQTVTTLQGLSLGQSLIPIPLDTL